MQGILDRVNNQLLPALSLERLDASWEKTVRHSRILGPWLFLSTRATAAFSRFSGAGTAAQRLSYVLVAVLFAIIAAPQFASDKEVLALVVLAALALRIAGSIAGGGEQFHPAAVDMLVLLFFGINVIATGASHYLFDSVKGLAKLVVYVAAYFLFVSVLQTNTVRRITTIWCALVSGALLVSLYGLYQYKIGVAPLATWEDPNVETQTTRIFSTLKNPNLLAGYLLPVFPAALAAGSAALTWTGWRKFASVPLLAAAGTIGLAIVLTGSRGGYLGFAVAAGVMILIASAWVWQARPRLRPLVLAAVIAIPVIAALTIHSTPALENRILSMFAGREHSSNSYRFNVWLSSLKMLADSWWIGIGPGNNTFRLAYGLYMRSGFDALGTYSVPLEIAVQAGIFALLAFGWLLVAVLARAHRIFWSSADISTRFLAAGSAVAIAAVMAHGLVDTIFYRPQVQLIFWLMVACVVALGRAKVVK